MDIGTIIGIVVAVGCIVVSILWGGGSIGGLINMPSLFIVFGGTIGAIVIAFPLQQVLKVHTVFLKTVFSAPVDIEGTIKDLVRFAEVARREGILALENLIGEMKDPFIVTGVKMAVDGTDPELIESIMETEVDALAERHAQGKAILDQVGKYAPAFGMIGTLMGLIAMLKSLDDPSAIGPGMAVALITTLYGAIIANVITGPFADKLAARNAEEMLIKTIITCGVMSIQSGDNPRVVESKLLTFLPPSRRGAVVPEAA